MAERRKIRTPFQVKKQNLGWEIVSSDGSTVALVFSEEHAKFICRACNLHDPLMSAYDLCRGHVNNMTLQPGNVTLKNLHDLFQRIADDISKSGR